jgi:hypothetical protein
MHAAGTARFQNFLDARLLESKITYTSASLWSNFLLLCVPQVTADSALSTHLSLIADVGVRCDATPNLFLRTESDSCSQIRPAPDAPSRNACVTLKHIFIKTNQSTIQYKFC